MAATIVGVIKWDADARFRSIHRWVLRKGRPATGTLLRATAEDALQRQQAIVIRRQIKRPAFTPRDRVLLALLARLVYGWRTATPANFLHLQRCIRYGYSCELPACHEASPVL